MFVVEEGDAAYSEECEHGCSDEAEEDAEKGEEVAGACIGFWVGEPGFVCLLKGCRETGGREGRF